MRAFLKYMLLGFFAWVSAFNGRAQQDSIAETDAYIFYRSTDSIPVVSLDSVTILPRLRFADYKEIKRYRWLRRRVYRVYPFARLSGENVAKLDKRLARMKSKRHKKRYMRIVKRWIKKEFEPQLKKLTRSEGRILSKLFHRQTGQTVYEFLKKYKSSWTAFWYQNMAKLYKIDLKVKFDPVHNKEDYWIEYILQKAFQDEILEPQPNKLGYKFIDLQNKWKPKHIPVKERLKKLKQRSAPVRPLKKITKKTH